jgi:hypothetical protein
VVLPRVNWARVNLEMYEHLTSLRLESLGKNGFNDIHPEVLVTCVNKILVDSAIRAEGKTPKPKKHRNSPWNNDLKPLIAAAKAAHYQWIQDKSCPDAIGARKDTKRALRSAQRTLVALHREEFQAKIMEVHEHNSTEYYALIAKQRKTTDQHVTINFGGTDDQLEGWRQYFEDLATPKHNPEYDQEWLHSMTLQVLLIEELNADCLPPKPVCELDIEKHVRSLKTGKSPDIFGVSAEHVKHASRVILPVLTMLTNHTLSSGKLAPQYKLGALTPVPKGKKDLSVPDNYRRITVCSILGKVVEKEIAKRLKEVVDPNQSNQQHGFTAGRSPSTCALIITEATAESMDRNETLYITFLDAKKAFDTVCHIPMLLALHQHDVSGSLWNVLNDMYQGIQSQVKLQGLLSEKFPERQGIRQGGLTSTDLYKVKANQMLEKLSSHPLAYRIGAIPVGAPTTADDTAIITSSELGAKVLMGIAEQDARIQQYSFSTQKTKLMIINPQGDRQPNVMLNGANIATTALERHLGIERSTTDSAKNTIDSRIKEARRALYSLAGAGLHGLNGVGPKVAIHMFNVYVYPILTYGLEALKLENEHYQALETFYKGVLRKIQHLPDNTATPAIYLLLGCIPLKAQIHVKLLTFFAKILRSLESTEYNVIRRQLAVKELSSNSWVNQIRHILSKYELPSAYQLLMSPPGKDAWKNTVVEAVATHWMEDLCQQARSMSTLNHLDLNRTQYRKVADVWLHNSDPLDAIMATVKARLLVQRYPLGYSHYAGSSKTKSCKLCNGEEETIEHFLLVCPNLTRTRNRHLSYLQQLAVHEHVCFPVTSASIVQFILTPGMYVGDDSVALFEQATRKLVYRLHCTRSSLLEQHRT